MLMPLARLVPIHRGERLAVGVLFTHYFLVSAAVIAGKAARDAFFLSRYDKSILPLMYLLNAIVVTLAMVAFSRVIKRFSPAAGAALTLGFFSVTLLLIELKLDGFMIGVLYVWMEVIGAVVILHAWLLTGDAFDPRQAKRLFGVIAAGGSIAAWAGGMGIAWAVARFGSSSLITVVAVALGLAMCTAAYGSRFRAPRPRSRSSPVVKAPRPWRLSSYVSSIAVLIAATAVVSAVIQYRFQVASVAAYPGRDQLVAFFGQFYAWTGAASLLSQLFLSSLLLSRFGVIAGLFVLPACFSLGSIFTLLSPSLFTAGFGRFSDLTFKFTVQNSSVEMLWLPVPPEERRSVKPFVSGTLKSVSEASAALLMFVFVKFTAAWVLSAFALSVCGVWVTTVLRLRSQYRQALLSVIEKRQLNPEALRVSATDPIVVQSINRALRSSDEGEQMAALSFLDGLPLHPWSVALRDLLADGSPEIRERVFTVAGKDHDILPDQTVLSTCRAGGPLARIAIEVAAERRISELTHLLADFLNSEDPHTSLAAAVVVLRRDPSNGDRARDVVTRWLDSGNRTAITQVLLLLARESGVLPAERLSLLIRSSDFALRCAALECVAARKEPALVTETIAALADARCARPARLALRELPAELVTPSLIAAFKEAPDEKGRRAVLRVLREYPSSVAEDTLAGQIVPQDLETYSEFAELLRAVQAVRPLRSNVTDRVLQDGSIIRGEAYFYDAMNAQLAEDADALLLRDYACQRYEVAVGTTLRITALQHPAFPLDACLHMTKAGDRATMPYLLELLESTMTAEGRRLIIPLIDPSQVERRRLIERELFTDPKPQIDSRIQTAASSRDPWEAAVAVHYLARKGKLAGAATVGGYAMGVQDHNMYSTLEKTIMLKSSDVFGGLPAASLATLAAIATEVRSPADTLLFREGESGDSLYVVASGRVRIAKGGSEIAVLGKGSCFGEMAVLDQAPRSADAIVIDEAVLLRIESEEFYEALAENPALTQGVVRLLTRRLREANARIAQAQC
jgi:AAA family ATP:ADP antiporter